MDVVGTVNLWGNASTEASLLVAAEQFNGAVCTPTTDLLRHTQTGFQWALARLQCPNPLESSRSQRYLGFVSLAWEWPLGE